MGVRADIDALVRQEFGRPHLIEEDEGPDHLTLRRGQSTAHLEAAQIAGAGNDHSARWRQPASPSGIDASSKGFQLIAASCFDAPNIGQAAQIALGVSRAGSVRRCRKGGMVGRDGLEPPTFSV